MAKVEAGSSQRSSKKLPWALLQVPGYTGKDDVLKKTTPKKPGFLTREEMEACRRREAWKDWVINHQEESIGERYFSIRQQVGQFTWEVKALQFFEPEGKETDLACGVLAMADWAVEYNELSNHPLLVIPLELQIPYSGPQHGRGQFPLAPTLEESSSTDIRIRCQAWWMYLYAMLQYFEDDMIAWEGTLFGRRTCQPSALVLYIMENVNPGPPRRFPGRMAEYCRKYSMAYFPEPHESGRTGPFLQ